MPRVNKLSGNRFEMSFTSKLGSQGFWVHNFQQNFAGQPVDIIACRNGKVYLIDCKVCENGVFRFDRIETNQLGAMRMFAKRFGQSKSGWFALLYDSKIYMLSLDEVEEWQTKRNNGVAVTNCVPYERWVENA